MKKIYSLLASVLIAGSLIAQNGLMTTFQTGDPIGSKSINDFDFAYDDATGDLVLIAATGSNGTFYFIDMNHLSSTGVHDLTQSQISGALGQIASALGTGIGSVRVWNMENNPKTRSTFILASNGVSGTRILFEVKSATSVAQVNFSSVNWCSTVFSSTKPILDITWGNDTLYYTVGSFSLAGEIAAVPSPFTQGMATINRNTTAYKTNWGGNYFTTAPLEKLDYVRINGEHRLIGVTTCAPGFSIPTSDVRSAGLLQVKEDFNVRFNQPTKVFGVTKTHHSYLFNFHSNVETQRIGERFIDGTTPATNNQQNNNVIHLRTTGGAVTPGLQSNEMAILNSGDKMICYYSEDAFLRLTSTGDLLIHNIDWATVSGVEEVEPFNGLVFSPNPVQNQITLNKELIDKNPTITITSIDGKKVFEMENVQHNTIDLTRLQTGNYLITVRAKGQIVASEKIVKL